MREHTEQAERGVALAITPSAAVRWTSRVWLSHMHEAYVLIHTPYADAMHMMTHTHLNGCFRQGVVKPKAGFLRPMADSKRPKAGLTWFMAGF